MSDALLRQGLAVRGSAEGIRITPRDRRGDDVLLAALDRLIQV
jgi:hypothetical protein